ncbi:MAG: MBL fold metallo-hydrolase, partial [Clostridioides difficile]|nr:MBL fold metallo-hydrolase [Clostridioides difficile]
KETLDKFSERKIKVYRTDESGTIVATSDGKNITFDSKPSKSNTPGSGNKSYELEDESNNSKEIANSNNNYDTVQKFDSETVWVSGNNAKVYHKDNTCSNMKNPTKYTLEEAEAKELRSCSKCYK